MSEKEDAPVRCHRQPQDLIDFTNLPRSKNQHAVATAALAAQIIATASAANAEHPLIKHFDLSGDGYIQIQGSVLLPLPTSSGQPASFVQIYRDGTLRLVGGDQVEWERNV